MLLSIVIPVYNEGKNWLAQRSMGILVGIEV
jgi:hypothetical protein